MIRIDDRTVELTNKEVLASNCFENFLDRGMGVIEAAEKVQLTWPSLDPEFINWLKN
jgi:hypothetical protein